MGTRWFQYPSTDIQRVRHQLNRSLLEGFQKKILIFKTRMIPPGLTVHSASLSRRSEHISDLSIWPLDVASPNCYQSRSAHFDLHHSAIIQNLSREVPFFSHQCFLLIPYCHLSCPVLILALFGFRCADLRVYAYIIKWLLVQINCFDLLKFDIHPSCMDDCVVLAAKISASVLTKW